MRKGKRTLNVLRDQRLSVFQDAGACCGISHMSDGNRSGKRIKDRMVENFTDQSHVLMAPDPAIVIDGNAAALLSTVLQGKKAIIHQWRDLKFISVKNTENSAFFVAGTDHATSPAFSFENILLDAYW